MKKTLLIALIFSGINFSFGQQQIGNSDFENWEAVAGDEEPVNWNSFLSADGFFSSFAANQIESSSDVRPGSAGTKSCRIWSRNALGIIANGNVTLGRINMGSATPTNEANYNITLTANPNFSQTLTDEPDSIVFWAKFTPNGGSGNARMKATLHDNYNYRDPEDAASSSHVVATAVVNFPNTNGNWTRFAIPFDYSGPASGNTHVLVTFTTNMTPGGGDADDQVWIDDVELIYNPEEPVGISEVSKNGFTVGMDNVSNEISISSKDELQGNYMIYNSVGQVVQTGAIASKIKFEKEFGIYFVHLATENGVYTFEILKN